MTQTIDTTRPAGWRPDPSPDDTYSLAYQSNEYLRLIHWWVRLFGIIWIVIPILFVFGAIVFIIGVGAFHGADSTSYSRCVSEALYSAAECARMYPR